MTTIQDRIIKSFDKKFIRDDGLIDKYGYSKNGELDTTANLIKQFLIQSIKLVEEETRKETIDKYFNEIYTMGRRDGELKKYNVLIARVEFDARIDFDKSVTDIKKLSITNKEK